VIGAFAYLIYTSTRNKLSAQLARVLPLVRVARPVSGHHQDHRVRRQFADRRQQTDTIQTGHPDVGQHDIHELSGDDFAGGQAVIGDEHLEAVALEQDAQPFAHRLFVIDYEDPGHA